MLFAALLLCAMLSGCRKPVPPTAGWVRLSALTPLHPNQAMVDDLDRRLEGLAEQRRRLLDRQTFALPPEYVREESPPLATLPSPAPSRLPGLAALPVKSPERVRSRQLAEEDRSFLRHEREQRMKIAEEMPVIEATLRHKASNEKDAIAQRYRADILQSGWNLALLESRVRTARREADTAKDRYESNRASLEAKKAFLSSQQQLKSRQRTKLAKEIAEQQQRVEQQSARNAALAREAAKLDAEAATLRAKYERDRRNYEGEGGELARVDQKLTAALAAASARNESILAQMKVAHRNRRQAIEQWKPSPEPSAERSRDIETVTTPTFDMAETPTHPLEIETLEFHHSINNANFKSLQQRLAAVRTIDETVHRLTLRRIALTGVIARDTADAARSVALQHGFQITVDQPTGKDVTNDVRAWLGGYWPENTK